MAKKKHRADPEPPFFDERGAFHFRPMSSDARFAARLDALPEALAQWFESFESSCAMSCCGLHALAFEPSTEWARWRYEARVVAALRELRAQAEAAPSEVLTVPNFMVALYKSDFLFLLDFLLGQLQASIEWNI